jgi:hypothetical protein
MKHIIMSVGLLAAVGLVACGSEEPNAQPGGEVAAAEEGRLGLTRLASIELDDGRRVVLRSFRPSRNAISCLSLVGIDEWTRQCGYAPTERSPVRTGPIAPGAIAQLRRSAPLEVYGETSADVARVALQYAVNGLNGSSRRASAELLRVIDPEILERAGISEPFGYFFGELPSETAKVRAIALDSERMTIGSAGFGDIRRFPPTAFIAEAAAGSWCCR